MEFSFFSQDSRLSRPFNDLLLKKAGTAMTPLPLSFPQSAGGNLTYFLTKSPEIIIMHKGLNQLNVSFFWMDVKNGRQFIENCLCMGRVKQMDTLGMLS